MLVPSSNEGCGDGAALALAAAGVPTSVTVTSPHGMLEHRLRFTWPLHATATLEHVSFRMHLMATRHNPMAAMRD